MIIEEAPKKTKEQILQEEASLAEAIRLDTLEKEEEAKQICDDWTEDKLRRYFGTYLKNMFEGHPLVQIPIGGLLGQQRLIVRVLYYLQEYIAFYIESSDIYMLTERTYPVTAKSKLALGVMKIDELDILNGDEENTLLVEVPMPYTIKGYQSTMSNRLKDWLVQSKRGLLV
ncbi:hypothetical protein Tco_0615311 [Tanacetum coccineum]